MITYLTIGPNEIFFDFIFGTDLLGPPKLSHSMKIYNVYKLGGRKNDEVPTPQLQATKY